mgnify:CR=1 FL=1
MQTGSQMSHSINISNGTEKTTFNLAFEYMSEDGLVKLDNMDRYNATLSLSHKLTDNLKLNANVVYTYLDQNIRRDPFNRSIYYAPMGMYTMKTVPSMCFLLMTDRPSADSRGSSRSL